MHVARGLHQVKKCIFIYLCETSKEDCFAVMAVNWKSWCTRAAVYLIILMEVRVPVRILPHFSHRSHCQSTFLPKVWKPCVFALYSNFWTIWPAFVLCHVITLENTYASYLLHFVQPGGYANFSVGGGKLAPLTSVSWNDSTFEKYVI